MKTNSLKKHYEKAKLLATTTATCGILATANFVFAEADGGALLEKILELLTTILIPFGVILGIMGIVHYASAKSEGDGPASNKAIGQMAAGVMLIVLSIAIKGMAGDFAGMITS